LAAETVLKVVPQAEQAGLGRHELLAQFRPPGRVGEVAGPDPCCGGLTCSSKSRSPSCRCLRASLRVRTVICKKKGAHSIISESTIMCACSYWHDTSRYIHILNKYIQILVNTFVYLHM
jgi:hypothetical protein